MDCSVFTLGLDSDVKLCESGEESRDVLVRLAQLVLVVSVLCLVAGQLTAAFDLQAFILSHELLDSASKLDTFLLCSDQLVLVVALHTVDLLLGFMEDS